MNRPDDKDLTTTENKPIIMDNSSDLSLANHETRVIILRDFLHRNKIFFETVAASLLSLMAIIISAAQIFISVKQNALTAMQTEIARQQVMPQFVIAARQVIDTLDGKIKEDAIYVNNRGGIVRDLFCNTAVFFDVEFTPELGEQKKIELSVNGYYGSMMNTAEGTGQVLTIEGYHNSEKLSQIRKAFTRLAEEKKAFANIEVRRYLRLYYRDILGKEHVDYYYVPLIYGGSAIETREGEKIFEKRNSAVKNLSIVEFDKLTAENLFQRLN